SSGSTARRHEQYSVAPAGTAEIAQLFTNRSPNSAGMLFVTAQRTYARSPIRVADTHDLIRLPRPAVSVETTTGAREIESIERVLRECAAFYTPGYNCVHGCDEHEREIQRGLRVGRVALARASPLARGRSGDPCPSSRRSRAAYGGQARDGLRADPVQADGGSLLGPAEP